jgi:hypothetical protein
VTDSIRIEGLTGLRRSLAGADAAVKKEMKAANREALAMVAETARSIAPNGQTGKLKGSIRIASTIDGGSVRAGGPGVPYAGPIHFGWSTRPNSSKGWRGGPITPDPFLYDALDARRDEVVAAYARNLEAFTQKHFSMGIA